jgi:hypothetical protein
VKKTLSLLALVPVFFSLHAAALETAAVKLLATIHVGTRVETFSVKVPNCGNDIESVKIVLEDAPVTVQTFGARFTDGTSREFTINRTFRPGTDSGWIRLDLFRSMDSRCPASIYSTASSTGQATVQIYGNLK